MGISSLKKPASPALVLLFLSPAIGELLSGSAPPAEFFRLPGFLLLTILYGGGAILARELMHRWGKGWPALLLLGASYGIAEEGLMCKSFFDPNWVDLGILGEYGRFLGVNWVWSLLLTFYHAVFSIAIPVLLVTLIFPGDNSRKWLNQWNFKLLFLLWIANGVLIFFFISPYRPPLIPYLIALIVTIGLGVLARYMPFPMSVPGNIRIARPFWFGLTGFLTTFSLFFLAWGSPGIGMSPWLAMLLMVGLAVIAGWVILKILGNGIAGSPRHQFALVSGALGFFILLAPLQEINKARLDDTGGMSLVSLLMLVFLFWIWWYMKKLQQAKVT
ncbi:MAG: hypothetical protein GXO71_05895 [Caldiserica bacterium]|nr:hypothetical protein [Caldisericota bacterium]